MTSYYVDFLDFFGLAAASFLAAVGLAAFFCVAAFLGLATLAFFGLSALAFFGLSAFAFFGLSVLGILVEAGFLAFFGDLAALAPAGFVAAFGFLAVAALGFFSFLASAPRRKLPDAPEPLDCLRLSFLIRHEEPS